MSERNENRPGYKKTKVGWIPEEWDCLRLSSIATIERGRFGHRPRNAPQFYGGKYPFVQTGDISRSRTFVREYSQTLNNYGLAISKMFRSGTILMTIAANIGDCAILTFDSACPDSLVGIDPNDTQVDTYFLHTYLNSVKEYKRYLAPRSAQHNINVETISAYSVPFPPFPEQKKIAAILSAWDEAIEQMRRLIDGKKRRKKALMQQLLTGKKRLPAFKGAWAECSLGDVFNERREVNGHDLQLLAITGSRGVIPASEIERKDSSNPDKSRYKIIRRGDIGYNTMRMWQGISAVSGLDGIVSPAYTICVPKDDVDVKFMGYFFKFPPVVHLFWRYSQGLVSDTLNLKFNNFAQIKVRIPSIDEQGAIAEVLSAADNEIKVIEKKLTALEKQKRGLMQKLLTGEIRVKT